MSEHITHEQARGAEALPSNEAYANPHEAHQERHVERSTVAKADTLEAIRKSIAETATSGREMPHGSEQPSTQTPAWYMHQDIKLRTLGRNMRQIRHKLSPSERAFSRTIHQPLVRAVSETASKTVARPSGLLGGGVGASIGSLLLLAVAKHIGFSYNYLAASLLFVAGFFLGLVVELIWKIFRPHSR